jgi:hypothetical protein
MAEEYSERLDRSPSLPLIYGPILLPVYGPFPSPCDAKVVPNKYNAAVRCKWPSIKNA